MKQYFLTEIVTKDKLIHQGIYFEPKKKIKRAILFVHGLTSTFYGQLALYDAILEECGEIGVGFAAFNNRGHDLIAGIKKVDPSVGKGYTRVSGGAGCEKFEECIFDIDAGIDFLVGQGYSEIILVGHSTGASKACYYAGTIRNNKVLSVILLSPVSDRLDPAQDKETLPKKLRFMKKLIADGRGDEVLIGYHFFPCTPKRFLSLYAPLSNEDVFDYGDRHPELKVFSQIKMPLLVVLGDKDEFLDRPVENVMREYDSHAQAKTYKSIVVKNALHSYGGHEKEVARHIAEWLGTL